MEYSEAMALLVRIENQWHTPRWTQVLLDDWREELEKLEAGPAGTAYARLRAKMEHRPNIAQYLAEYRQVRPHDASTRRDCPRCDNTGWQPVIGPDGELARTHALTGLPDGYSAVTPCSCEHGEGPRRTTAA